VPFHWLQSKQATLKQVAAEIGSGDILVLHENLPGPTPQELAAEILPPLLAAGYQFVTVDELRHGLAVQPQP
jgi:peptidoglycan/xylan/chitin deacetylase (PgdA/CDA1 family)